jgi:hypothetical protein
MLLVYEKPSIWMSVQKSCVGVEVSVGGIVEVAVGVAVCVGVCVALGGMGVALGALVAVSMGVREAAGVLVDVLNAEVVPVSASVESSVPSYTGGVDGSSDPLASVSNTCSVAAITV